MKYTRAIAVGCSSYINSANSSAVGVPASTGARATISVGLVMTIGLGIRA